MARVVALAVFAFCMALLVGAGCASCSEECSGLNVGAPGCPCSTDVDCSTRDGNILVCREGACEEGDPLDAPALAACSDDGECPAGQACGALERCFFAPECQRIDPAVALVARTDDTAVFEVAEPALDGCSHTWTLGTGGLVVTTSFTIGLDGTLTFPDGDACQSGTWLAPRRVGELSCGGSVFVVSDATVSTCFETCAAGACTVVGSDVGVCQ